MAQPIYPAGIPDWRIPKDPANTVLSLPEKPTEVDKKNEYNHPELHKSINDTMRVVGTKMPFAQIYAPSQLNTETFIFDTDDRQLQKQYIKKDTVKIFDSNTQYVEGIDYTVTQANYNTTVTLTADTTIPNTPIDIIYYYTVNKNTKPGLTNMERGMQGNVNGAIIPETGEPIPVDLSFIGVNDVPTEADWKNIPILGIGKNNDNYWGEQQMKKTKTFTDLCTDIFADTRFQNLDNRLSAIENAIFEWNAGDKITPIPRGTMNVYTQGSERSIRTTYDQYASLMVNSYR